MSVVENKTPNSELKSKVRNQESEGGGQKIKS